MLQDIIDSKTDSAVLSFFLAAPERSFSVKEVSGRLKIPMRKAVRSMNILVGQGHLRSFSKRGKKYYLINSRSPVLPELKQSLVKNGIKYQDELFLAIRRLGDIKAAYLSGLFAGQPQLPVDILLVGKVNLRRLDEFMKNAEKLMGQELNYSIMTPAEFQMRRNTFDRFIKDIFDYRHVPVFDDLAKKKK